MNIDLAKIESMGFEVSINKDRSRLSIFPISADPTATQYVRELCAVLGFNDSETEETFSAVAKIQVISAIRKCSGW